MASHFNPIDYSQQLEAVGVPKAQAEVHANTLLQLMNSCVATKGDLRALDDKLSARMDAFEARVKAELAGMRVELAGMRVELADMRVALADMRTELAGMRGQIKLFKWMSGVNTALLIGLYIKAYLP
jgi:hypothetical protein